VAISIVQSKNVLNPGSATASFTSSTTAGNCVVAILCTYATTNVTISTSAVTLGGNADNFRQLASVQSGFASSDTQYAAIWIDQQCAGGQTAVAATVSNATWTDGAAIILLELAGVAVSNPWDLNFTSTDSATTGTAITSGTAGATIVAGEFVIGVAYPDNGVTAESGSFTNITVGSSPYTATVGTATIATVGSTLAYTATGGSSGIWSALEVALMPARVYGAISGHAVQAKLPRAPGRPRGRTYGNPGSRFVKITPGPAFYPRHDPARIHPVLPPRGRVAFNKGGKVKNPASGPVFRQRVTPARAPIPKTWSKGWSRGTVIQLPWNSFFGNASLNVGITLTAGAYSAWQYIGQVPLTYLQYLMQGGTLQVTPGEYIQVAGPASGWSYELPLPPPDGRWLTTGTGGHNILGIVKLPEPEVDIFSWEPPEGQENMPIPFAVIAERIRRRQRRE